MRNSFDAFMLFVLNAVMRLTFLFLKACASSSSCVPSWPKSTRFGTTDEEAGVVGAELTTLWGLGGVDRHAASKRFMAHAREQQREYLSARNTIWSITSNS